MSKQAISNLHELFECHKCNHLARNISYILMAAFGKKNWVFVECGAKLEDERGNYTCTGAWTLTESGVVIFRENH